MPDRRPLSVRLAAATRAADRRHAYRKWRAKVLPNIGIVLGAILGLVLAYFFNRKEPAVAAVPLTEHYEAQDKALEEAQKSAQQIDALLGTQDAELSEGRLALERLKAEQQRLQIVVAADRAVVDSFFEEQRQRHIKDAWNNRVEGVMLGLVSAWIGNAISRMYRSLRRRARRAI